MRKRASNARGRSAGEPLAESIAPQLATLASRPPATGNWLYEIQFHGYRLM